MTLSRICLIGISLLCLTGCGPADYGFVGPERYQEPPPIELTEQEQGILDLLSGQRSVLAMEIADSLTSEQREGLAKFAVPAQSALVKVMKQKNAWRAIVQEHNKVADERIKDLLKKSGVKVKSIELEAQKRY